MNFCQDVYDQSNKVYRCQKCGSTVSSATLRQCPSDLFVSAGDCLHRRQLGRVRGDLLDCGCRSIPLYNCDLFTETVTDTPPKPDAARLIRDNQLLPGVRTKYLGRSCTYCRVRNRVTVLHVSRENWRHRTTRFVQVLREQRIPSTFATAANQQELAAAVQRHQPAVVFVHAFQIPVADVAAVAARSPAKFVIVCHSSQNHLPTNERYAINQAEALQAAAELPNVYYASPERTHRLPDLGWPRVIEFPNPFPVAEIQIGSSPPIDPPTLLVAGRVDMIKALPATILAAGLVTQQRPGTQTIVLCRHRNDTQRQQLQALATAARITPEWREWLPWPEFRDLLRYRVSVVLQPSVSESFNYIALEAASQSRPTVGADTIRYLPCAWRADPNDPATIARRAIEILADYTESSQRATRLAYSVASRQNREFISLVRQITVRP